MRIKNEIGNTYGYLTVIERAENTKDGHARWKCKCMCGNETIVLGKHLRSGNTKSCGCYQKQRATESNLLRGGDLTGRRFGKLTVIRENGFINKSDGRNARLWLCRCDCGNECNVQHQYLSCGDTNSCGCINSVGNATINRLLNLKGIKYKTEFSFKDFVCEVYPYQFDFGLLNQNEELLGLIEYQGDIHFNYSSGGWNTKESFEKRIKRDLEKKNYCEKNNIKLFYITYKEDIEERLEEILNELYSK